MTPEDIETLKQLKALLDDGVITEAEFAAQKQLVMNPELEENGVHTPPSPGVRGDENRDPIGGGLNRFGGSDGSEVDSSSPTVSPIAVLKPSKVFAGMLVIVALFAIGVVVSNRGGNSEGKDVGRPTRTSVTPVDSETSDSAAPRTEAPVEEDLC